MTNYYELTHLVAKEVASLLGVITWGVYSSPAWHILEHLAVGVEMHLWYLVVTAQAVC
jgi:hypothetical protein